jgi:Concanavalin A-like lectin/glucanases superfamily
MGSNAGPKIPKVDSMRFHIDAFNTKSYPGTGNTWTDLSNAGIAGTKVGTTTFVGGGSTSSINIAGAGYYEFSNPTSLDITPSITMNAIWLNRGWSTNWQTLFAKGDNSYRISRDSTGAGRGWYAVGVNPNTYWQSGIATSHAYDIWQMITVVFNQPNSLVTFYNNGIATTNVARSSALGTTTARFWVGNNSEQTARQINGNIAVIQLFDTPLSAADVQDLYASFKGRYGLT